MVNLLEQYRASAAEQERTADLLRLLPPGRRSVLDIGARDGYFSRLLTNSFEEVIALDLNIPTFAIDRVQSITGDATRLPFASNSIDCVFCAEVLEHIPNLQHACSELLRVAKYELIIGVPYKQDIRVGRLTCRECGKVSPPWGHLHSFDELKLGRLFAPCELTTVSYVGSTKAVTNSISSWLMDMAGNPWGPYYQEEPCNHCGMQLVVPRERRLWQRVCSAMAGLLNKVQTSFATDHAQWIHVVVTKKRAV